MVKKVYNIKSAEPKLKCLDEKKQVFECAELETNLKFLPEDKDKFEEFLNRDWNNNLNIKYHEVVEHTTVFTTIKLQKPIALEDCDDRNHDSWNYIYRKIDYFKEDCKHAMDIS